MGIFGRRKRDEEFEEEFLESDAFFEEELLKEKEQIKNERKEKRLLKKASREEAKAEKRRRRELKHNLGAVDDEASEQKKKASEKEVNIEESSMPEDILADAELKKVISKEELLLQVESSCEQMIICQERLENIKHEYREINNYLSDIETIERLEEPLKSELENEVRRIKNLTEDKNNYKHAAAKMSEARFEFIESREKDMSRIMRDLKKDEDYIQSMQTDMHHLEGEKHALLYEKELYLDHMELIRKIFIAVILLAGTLITGFTIGQLRGEYDYTIGYYIVTVLTLIALAIILVVRQNEERELKITELKLNKAIGLLNRYKLRYVNLKSSVDYTYQVYGVSNSYELNNLWSTYITTKKEREAYFTMSDNLYKANNRFLEIIESLNLNDASVWNYQMYAIIDGEEMMVIKNTLLSRKEGVKKNMDYNSTIIKNSKEKIKNIISENPKLSKSVLALIDRKEKEFENRVSQDLS